MIKNIGVFSGAFDPIHDGHLALAKAAKAQAGLDLVILLVEPSPRRKPNVSDIKHRLAMGELVAKKYSWLRVHKLAQRRFTVAKTLPELKTTFKGAELAIIMGGDVFASLPQWPNIDELIDSSKFIVSIRRSEDIKKVEDASFEIGAEFMLVKNRFPEVSSSKIREQLRKTSPKHIDRSVVAYITKNKLYADKSSDKA